MSAYGLLGLIRVCSLSAPLNEPSGYKGLQSVNTPHFLIKIVSRLAVGGVLSWFWRFASFNLNRQDLVGFILSILTFQKCQSFLFFCSVSKQQIEAGFISLSLGLKEKC